MTPRIVSLLASLLLLACTVVTPTATDGGADGATASDGAIPKSGGSSCGQALACIVNCPANDDPCANACFSGASAAGQMKIQSLVDCITKNACMDSTCTTSKCQTELSACLDDAPPDVDSGIPPQMGTPLPANLVGTWSRVSLEFGLTYTFNANGTYSLVSLYSNSGTCITIEKLATSFDGQAAVSGDQLVLSPTTGSIATTDCYAKTTSKPASLTVKQFTWSVAGNMLTLTNADGPMTFTKQ